MIRKDPVYKKSIGLNNIELKYSIPDIEKLEPFICAKWNAHMIYFTESLYNRGSIPMAYFFTYYDDVFRAIVSGRMACIGDFYNAMSDTEKILFRDNFLEINNLIKLL
jgi:hypothetical protein